MGKARFEARLVEGHQGLTVVIVPFDPEAVWRQKPLRLAGRRHGWLVKGTANGATFNGYIGDRWGRFFIQLDDRLCKTAGASIGDSLSMVVEPTDTAKAYFYALEQSKMTTQPSRARTDAIAFPDATLTKRRKSATSAGQRSLATSAAGSGAKKPE
jgi:hypothetical protein